MPVIVNPPATSAATAVVTYGVPLAYGQVSVRDFLMGKGTDVTLVDFDPFAMTVRSDEDALENAHGGYSGAEFVEPKRIPITVAITADGGGDQAGRFALMQGLLAAFAPSPVDVPLRFHYDNRIFRINGRPRAVEPRSTLLDVVLPSEIDLQFVALDPRIYSDEQVVTELSLPRDSGGRTYPYTFPYTIDATLSSGRADVVNEGTFEAPWRGLVYGPVVNPRLVNFSTGQELRVGVTVPAGRYLDLDSAVRRVLLDGTASRRGSTSGQWWQLAPGVNDIGFFADVFSEDASFQLLHRHSWR